MEKSNHRYNNSIIPYEELTNFIEPINNIMYITPNDINNMTGNRQVAEIIKENINKVYDFYYSQFPMFNRLRLDDSIKKYMFSFITYTPHTTGYDFRYNPIEILNMIFLILHCECRIPFINLDNSMGREYFKDYAISHFNLILKTEKSSYKKAVIQELKENIDKFFNIYYQPIDLKSYIIPKDALFTLAYKSLNKYKHTKDLKDLVFAKEYYENVSHMRTSQYPHTITDNIGIRLWFEDFRRDYEQAVPENLNIDVSKYVITDQDVLLAWDILRPGETEKVLKEAIQKSRADSNVDYEKYQKLYEEKINFYHNSPYKHNILGRYGLSGYIGFTYNNEYLLFDKFHNSDTINPTRKTILTHGEAIYALPSDRFSILSGTKQNIIKEKETDERIKKLNHTKTFIQRAEQIIYGPNVSTSTFEEEIEKQKKKILIKNNY